MYAVRNKAMKQLTWAALATVALSAPAYAAGGMLEGLAGVKAQGYIEGQYIHNFNDPYTGSNVGRTFDIYANSFTGNMAELALNKTTDAGLGFGLVLNYGQDARLLDTMTPGSPIFVQQAYVMDRVFGNTVDLKFGKFATLAGAEVIEGPANYNISRSILFIGAIPFTHTGLRAGIGTGMKNVSLTLGLNNGWDADVDSTRSGKTL
ncbi:MAG TPA: outer membrane beta-barrel protein, partial [Nitrospiria bacterium]|nr:outer membrane beta-barrel protein [Nitrospiria bacterium]